MASFTIVCALPECGAVVTVHQPSARYCCAAHRAKAYRQQREERIRVLTERVTALEASR